MTLIAYRLTAPAELDAAVTVCWPLLGLDANTLASAWLDAPNTSGGIKLHDADLALSDAQSLPASWPEGRLFASLGELRWERIAAKYHLVLISDVEAALPDGYQGELRLAHEYDEHILLWGERSSRGWEEGRIPHLNYPNQWSNRYARLVVRHYYAGPAHERPYESLFVRYCHFETVNSL